MSSNNPTPTVSRRMPDGTLIELLYDAPEGITSFAVRDPDGGLHIEPHVDLSSGERLVPYSATNNLLTSGCVLLPSALADNRDIGDLVDDIRAYLARYVDLSPDFLTLAPYYVLLSWSYDAFNEVPILRFRGSFGSGKTRGLLVLGSISYKPFFASGASTVSPIFHILDTFRGTLVLDEADFRFSDATNELTKILNNGTVDGLPVLRTMTNRNRELNPQAFRVYGTKMLAMRESFSDAALESRCITEETGTRPLPPHIPICLPDTMKAEAQMLRNRLLMWRLTTLPTIAPDPAATIMGADPRTNQMSLPLLSLIANPEERSRVATWLSGQATARTHSGERSDQRMIAALAGAFDASRAPYISIADVAARYNEGEEVALSNKRVGAIIRLRFGISTAKSRGVYGIPQEERARIVALVDRLGVPRHTTLDGSPPDHESGLHVSTAQDASGMMGSERREAAS